MPRSLDRWPELRSEVADLHLLTHNDQGIYDEKLLLQLEALLNHKAIVSRRTVNPEASMVEAIEAAVADVGRWAVPLASQLLSRDEHEAVKLLLGITPPTRRLRRQPHGERAREAYVDKLGGQEVDVEAWRRHRRGGGSDETDLLGRWIRVLDQLEVPPSATRTITRTPPNGAGAPADVSDLQGTWAGRTESTRVHKDRRAGGRADTYMVIDTSRAEPIVRWYYRDGWAWSVSVRAVELPNARRLLIMYESDVSFADRKATPWHRGACLLEVEGNALAGPYWSDRQSFGFLIFPRLVTGDHLATTWEEASALDEASNA
jgi:hypothetical protein